MFKHNDPIDTAAEPAAPKAVPTVEEKLHSQSAPPAPSAELLRELMEKNLKWSQIIYEQNRKLNRKLAWSAVAEWMRLFIIVVPLVLGFIYFAPMLEQTMKMYSQLLGTGSTTTTPSYESILKLLPINSEQQQQVQQMIK